ncbi:MAG: lysine--tRNA ligase [Patescibacteria group bacterium]
MSQQQSIHWLDKLAAGILRWQEKTGASLHVDDMKTPSGRVHTGSLRGVLLHDAIAKVVAEKTDKQVVSTYVFNDMDPMDGLPGYLSAEEYAQHMGKPMFKIPAPKLAESGLDVSKVSAEEKARFEQAQSFGEFYAMDFIDAFRKLGCTQEIVWSHQLYQSGQMDVMIKIALDHVAEIKKIYKEVADYDLPTNWYPFQVICPQCGKVGTTLTTDWDGQEVSFECQPNKVSWAKGCGYAGKISPFGGTGKLLWKVDWPAHWTALDITIEGAGKDHTSAGGSRDMADELMDRVFKTHTPFDIPYEWILIRGAKMSSSKGVGTSAREFVELFPAEVGRYLFVSKNYNQVIDFDPNTMAIPDLFDEYDQAARIYWGQEQGDNRMGRAFELSQISNKQPQAMFLPRFRDIATWMQHPELDLVEKFTEVKGSDLTTEELAVLTDRKHYAKIWIERYAPADYQLSFKPGFIPEAAQELTAEQKAYLVKVDELIDSQTWEPIALQQALFDLAKNSLGAKQAFQAIYKAFLGKNFGPRAGYFLLAISTEDRKKHLKDLKIKD